MWGANNDTKRSLLKAFIKLQKVDVVCLQETKIKKVSDGLIRSLGPRRFLDWAVIQAKGPSGGIIIFWDSRVFQLMGKEEGLFTLSCRFRVLEDGFI